MSEAHGHFQVISVFPELIDQITAAGVVGTARKKGVIEVSTINPRKFAEGVHNAVDDRPFGGGDGMIMMTAPLEKSILEARERRPGARVVYLSPQGPPLKQSKVRELAEAADLILLCGRYSGVDQRLIHKFVDEELSIGDYVLSGGELAAGVLIDAVSRFLPGVLGHADSAEADSFAGGLLEAPLFTRPREAWGLKVPEVLLSGNHAKIEEWQRDIAILVTLAKRPDLDPLAGLSSKRLSALAKLLETMPAEERELLGLGAVDVSALKKGNRHV